MDKYFQTDSSYLRLQLSHILNTRTMYVCLTSEKRDNIKKELKHWHENRKSFTIIQEAILCCTLEHWAHQSLCPLPFQFPTYVCEPFRPLLLENNYR